MFSFHVINRCHHSFLDLLKFMVTLVAAKYDWKNDSPFTREHIAMRIMIFAVFVYYMTVTIQERFNIEINAHLASLDNIKFLSGALAVTSMFLILTPRVGWLFLFVWVIFLVKVALDLHRPFYDFGMLMDREETYLNH